MSNSRLHTPAKSENPSTTIGFRFHANDEELEELQSEEDNYGDKKKEMNLNLKLNTPLLTSESLDSSKSDEKSVAIGDAVRDQWNLLGRRTTSVDSTYESPFSNPIETWRKLNVLKEKLTKTVEEKISEMKIERSRARLINSKENSSISDSEDNSESSKLSEAWKDTEDLNSTSIKQSNDSLNATTSTLENALLENVKKKMENKEAENELRNRKAPDLVRLTDIKIATAKSEIKSHLLEETPEGVESGVEAEEDMESESFTAFDSSRGSANGDSNPPDGNYIDHRQLFNFKHISFTTKETLTVMALIGLVLYFLIPMPDFVRGFLLCFIIMKFYGKINDTTQVDDAVSLTQKSFTISDYRLMPPLKVPPHNPTKGVWVNEYEKEVYDPDYYSVTQTVPAYLELDNTILKLSRPKGKINKRATFDEPEYKLQFISQRLYNIGGCSIYLMPDGLTRKRLFSKKYPIVIFLKHDSFLCEKVMSKEGEVNEDTTPEPSPTTLESPKMRSSLYLFARCDRQKEEWYRRLLAASRLASTPSSTNPKTEKLPDSSEEVEQSDDSPTKDSSTPFETLFFDDDAAEIEEYLRYMAKFVNEEVYAEEAGKQSQKSLPTLQKKTKTKKKDSHRSETGDVEIPETKTFVPNGMSKKAKASRTSMDHEASEENNEHEEYIPCLQVQWFNAFINRILFDVFRSPYWLNKIHDKVQKKLNSIRLPYYVEDIEVIELDLGKTGPVFHRVSSPYIDDLGLWFDMDTSFDGLIRLTIQTHLNLTKLQKGMEEEEGETHTNGKTAKEKETKKESEVKDTLIIKESKEKSKLRGNRKYKKLEEECSGRCSMVELEAERVKPPENDPEDHSLQVHLEPYVQSKKEPSENCNLMQEVAKLAEIAIQEGLSENETIKEPIKCRCSEKSQSSRSAIYDSEMEDSAESSDEVEEEEEEIQQTMQPVSETEEHHQTSTARRYPKNRRSSKGIFRVFENVAQSKYFKSMAQSKYVQKAIAGVSAAKLRLTLEIKSCRGILTINIPPPPSDRFWFGFREMPKLVFSANPKIGDKTLRFVQIKNYLQKKILHEMKKVMVAPNMIDFVLPTSSPGRSLSSLQIDQPDISEQEATPPE